MKIEIGESLMLSYLKHVKKCILYQTNWKVSSNWGITNVDKVQYVYNKIINHSEFSDIFKSELNQLIKQSEIDVIGLDSNNTIFTVDIAFHEAGLNYGSKIETKNRIFKKLLRSYLTLLAYFPDKKYELLFSSPKVNQATEIIISDYFKVLENNFSDENVTFKYISNDKFNEDILLPTLAKTDNNSDTNELFIRSITLNNLFKEKFPIQKNNLSSTTILNQTIPLANINKKYNIEYGNELELLPDIETFRKKLLEVHRAKWTILYSDGRTEKGIWDARNITEASSIIGNIRSGYLRNWKQKGIMKATFEVTDL